MSIGSNTTTLQTINASDAAVSYNGFSKIYGEGEGQVEALRNIDFDLPRQSFVSVVGPSGCGKSTLLHATAGINPPTSGTVKVDGVDVTSLEHENRKIGMVFQKPVLLQWRDIISNIMLPAEILVENGEIDKHLDELRERAEELVELVGLEGFEDVYPKELSGGMQQRVSICRGLIHNPEVLLMDEPFGALDALTRDKMNQELLRIWKETKKTTLFVTHNLEESIYLSDYVVVLSSRPGEVLDIIDVDLERPRTEETRIQAEYHETVEEIYEYFE